jgi:hypothetical protein
MFKKHWVIVSLLVALALFVGGFVLVGENAKASSSRGVVPVAETTMVDMNGTWTQTSSGFSTINMTATINDGEISIDMSNGNLSGLYWKGTFPVSSIMSNGFTTTSVGDVAAMNSSMLASLDKTKTFSYKDGDLSYSFSMLGMTTTVHMKRSSE